MNQYIWINEAQTKAIHGQQISLFGGVSGILDEGKLSSALARPQNLYFYNSNVNIYQLAAAYGWGLVKNHPFIDGNKRCGFVVMAVFLKVNGFDLIVPETEVVKVMLALAAGEMSEEKLVAWLLKNSH
ncbi:MAG: type II toxin-antitoxin system death-on-curing family toxin [Gloeocapsa sp. DLM2.Bin57]|nr:MAG: type II toxin-antitoxin system death-on-curing family toxin [Gloeocapsa sp. DLM2.Bin57]